MNKKLLSLGVLLAVLCGALAYAVRGIGQGSLTAMSAPGSVVAGKLMPSEITRALSSCEYGLNPANRSVARNASSSSAVITEMWSSAQSIVTGGSGDGQYDEESNSISMSGSESQTYTIFQGVDVMEDGSEGYSWVAMPNVTYVFSGTLTSTGQSNVYPAIVYYNLSDEQLYATNAAVSLSESNSYTSAFEVSVAGLPSGSPIMVAFFVDGSTSETTITSTDNRLYYSVEAIEARQWSSDESATGLGFEGLTASNCYIATCSDGVTTLGLYDDGQICITGINTTASEVTLPDAVYVNGELRQIYSLGYSDEWTGNTMDWSSAASLKVLHMESVSYLNAGFSGTSLTDLYVGNCSFSGNAGGLTNIVLHIPYGANRGDYAWYGFSRVLVGEEELSYPVPTCSDWVIPGENEGEYFGIAMNNGYYCVAEIFTEGESVTAPAITPAAGGSHYSFIRALGADNRFSYGTMCQAAPNLKSITVPESYTNIYVSWSKSPISELHMQGDVPETYWTVPQGKKVYVSNKAYFNKYESDSSWKNAAILPEGWDFEWMTVNVERRGEFAQTYIEMTDADWSAGMFVKVTGALDSTDLTNIKNLTNLRKLDLSEASFAMLPASFLSNRSSLDEVMLPEALTMIPDNAFQYCKKLTKVTAPGVTWIGYGAFQQCGNLTDFDISNVKSIGNYAFNYCSAFNPTVFSADLYSIGSSAFARTSITELRLPEKMTTVSYGAFDGCSKLTKVSLPSGIKMIEDYAFSNCSALSEITLQEGLTEIGGSAFSGCSALGEIVIPSTLERIGYSAFNGCTSLMTVKCKAIVPPAASGNFTNGMDMNHCTLYVAPFAIDAYRAADYWNAFYIMKPLNEPVKNIYINRPMTFDLLSEDNAVLQENPNMTLDYDSSHRTIGELSASGDGTLSAGVFTIFHSFKSRSSTDYRPTLINNAENMRADNVLFSINFEKNVWHFISLPYDVQMSEVYTLFDTDYVIRQYNGERRASGEAGNWETVPADGVLQAGKGYIIQAANNTTDNNGSSRLAVVRFPSGNTTTKNGIFTSSNVIVPLEEYPAEFAHNRSWNLVGNPYPCYYNMHYLLDDFIAPIVLWRGTGYQAYSPVDDDIILRPNEAFFVQRPLDTDQMVFGAEGRMHYTNAINSSAQPGVRYAPEMSATESSRSVFNFNIEGCGSDDRARIVINEAATMDYEISRDAAKFFAETPAGVEVYVDGDIKYDICERPLESGVAVISSRYAQAGAYTLTLSGRNYEGWSVLLTDTKTGVTVDLTETAYDFDAEAGEDANRFIVTFRAPEKSLVDDLDAETADSRVQIVNVSGVVIYEGQLSDFMQSAQSGVYIVVDADKTYKVVVK